MTIVHLVLLVVHSIVVFGIARADGNSNTNDTVVIHTQYDSSLFKTVAHVNPDEIPDAVRIHVDYENDVAIYEWTNAHPDLEVGDTVVSIDGVDGTVTSIMAKGFTAKFPEGTIYAGLSGTALLKDGRTVGYVSSVKNQCYLYCIWT